MHGDQILGKAGHTGQDQKQNGSAFAHDPGELLAHDVGKARVCHGAGKGTQEDVGQGGAGVGAETVTQDVHGLGNGNARQHRAGEGGDDQGHEDIEFAKAQHTQHHHRGKDGVE